MVLEAKGRGGRKTSVYGLSGTREGIRPWPAGRTSRSLRRTARRKDNREVVGRLVQELAEAADRERAGQGAGGKPGGVGRMVRQLEGRAGSRGGLHGAAAQRQGLASGGRIIVVLAKSLEDWYKNWQKRRIENALAKGVEWNKKLGPSGSPRRTARRSLRAVG